MKRVATYLILLGALFWASPFVASLTPVAGNKFVSPHPHPTLLSICASFVFGALAFWLAWGINRRLLLAWRIGFIGLLAGWCWTVVEVSLSLVKNERAQTLVVRAGLVALVAVLFSLVFLYWVRRWHSQRSHFSKPTAG